MKKIIARFMVLPVFIMLQAFCSVFFLPARSEGTPLLRVLLRRLGIESRLDLRTAGPYLLESDGGTVMLLPGGASVTLELRDKDIVLFYEGASVSLGSALTLSRRSGEASEQGLYLTGGSALYPGDLRLTVSDGRLQPVLSLDPEDYLLGVVPYEMSDSFPLEALKAQAICARTYAMRKMGRSGAWDVVDTTNDQVFRGVSASNVNAARAVAETAGLVITSGGKLAEGYYSASNGGQTELPANVWGNADYARCYELRDDPWDAGNPESLTRSVFLPRNGNGLYRRIAGLLREAVRKDPAWSSGGFSPSESAFRVDAVTGIRLVTPRYASPSRIMTEAEFTLSVSGRRITGGTLGPFEPAGSFTVTLKLFPDVVDALGLSISGNGNEIITVTEEEDGFRLTSGRYGHGVGLSQRGAQYMASRDGKTCDEIIAFYFPGSEIRQVPEKPQVIPFPPERLAATPEPVAAATASPRPTLMPVTSENLPEGAWMASVENIGDGSSLNLRAEPSAASAIVMRLYKHQALVVLDDMDVPGWAYVRTDSAEGYVMTSFLERIEP